MGQLMPNLVTKMKTGSKLVKFYVIESCRQNKARCEYRNSSMVKRVADCPAWSTCCCIAPQSSFNVHQSSFFTRAAFVPCPQCSGQQETELANYCNKPTYWSCYRNPENLLRNCNNIEFTTEIIIFSGRGVKKTWPPQKSKNDKKFIE